MVPADGAENSSGAELDGGSEPDGAWTNATGNLAGLKSGCGTLALVSAHPLRDQLLAGVVTRGLWTSLDGGASWTALGLGALSTAVENVATTFLYDPDLAEVFWESGVSGSVGIVKTTDSGKHFKRRGLTDFNQSLSIDFADPDRKTQLVGGYNQKQRIFLSSDSGETWEDLGMQFPATADVSSFPLVIDESTLLMGSPAASTGKSGIYRSTDGGGSWILVSSSGGGSAPLVTKTGAIYWATSKTGELMTSTDQGVTFVQAVAPRLLQNMQPLELPDGSLAALSSQHVVVSTNAGKSWRFASKKLPYAATGFTYSAQQQAFFIWQSTCAGTNALPADAILRFEYRLPP